MYERVVAIAAPIKEYCGMRIRFRIIFRIPAAVVFAKRCFVFPIVWIICILISIWWRGIVISEKEFDEGIGEKEKGEEEGKCRDKNPFGDH